MKASCLLFVLCASLAGAAEPAVTLRVMIDPGHGGPAEVPTTSTGDNWDSEYARYLRLVNLGGAARLAPGQYVYEHELALEIARRLEGILALTQSETGWEQFQEMLRRLGGRGRFKRVLFEIGLTRRDDFRERQRLGEPDPGRDYRLFDSPSAFPPAEGMPLHPGRLSRIVEFAPDLVVVLHLNDQVIKSIRGMNALFSPSPVEYEALRRLVLTGSPARPEAGSGEPFDPALERLTHYWMPTGRAKRIRDSMIESAWYHYTGFGPAPGGRAADPQRPDGLVYNNFTWAYREPGERPLGLDRAFEGKYWEREFSFPERRRRGGGPELVGGDNLYAGQELLRFIRTALWRDAMERGLPAEVFGANVRTPDQALGEHDRPLCSGWTLPLLVNSVVAYLEMGYLSNAKDRWLFLNRQQQYAEGLAAGIYSLAVGLRMNPTESLPLPRGIPIRWSQYRNHIREAKWSQPEPPKIENLGRLAMPASFFKRQQQVSKQFGKRKAKAKAGKAKARAKARKKR